MELVLTEYDANASRVVFHSIRSSDRIEWCPLNLKDSEYELLYCASQIVAFNEFVLKS